MPTPLNFPKEVQDKLIEASRIIVSSIKKELPAIMNDLGACPEALDWNECRSGISTICDICTDVIPEVICGVFEQEVRKVVSETIVDRILGWKP